MGLVRRAAASMLRQVFPRQMYERRVFNTKQVEIEEDILPLLVDPCRESVDVGANLGRYMVALSRLSKHVHAFEPDAAFAEKLKRVARRNVSVSRSALSDRDGEAKFYLETGEDGAPVVANASLLSKSGAKAEVRTVTTTTLDSLADRDIGFIKIDVEGHEPEVLKGALRLLQKQHPMLLIEVEERHRPGALDEVRRLLGGVGYVGYFIADRRTHPIDDFRPALQDPQELRKPLPRREMRYVNNFIFVPVGRDGVALMHEIDVRLEGLSRR